MKTLIVTGASRGLGAHIAMRAQENDYHVVGLARNRSDSAPCEIVQCDVGDYKSVSSVARQIGKEHKIWGVVNCAGIAAMNMVMSTPPETVDRIINTNLVGTINISRYFGKLLVRRKTGRIINFSTIAVPLALHGEAIYAASKGGVETFSKAFAREMADYGVTVNCVAPGPIDTDLIAKVPSASIDRIIARQIIPKKGNKEDIWNITSLLLSEQSDMISGEVIHVGGA